MTKQNPFSVYDFLGYLIPGSVALYLLSFLHEMDNSDCSIDVFSTLEVLGTVNYQEAFFYVVLSYVSGHLLSFVSSITIESYAILKYDYPSKYLLGHEKRKFWRGCETTLQYSKRILLIILLFPVASLDLILGDMLGFKKLYSKGLDPLLKHIVTAKINKVLEKIKLKEIVKNNKGEFNKGQSNAYDYHRIVSHYAYEYSANHQAKMSNYVALYGFLRTLSLIFCILVWHLAIIIFPSCSFNTNCILIMLSAALTSYILFMAFMKFYRRYTLEGFMIITVNSELN